MFRSLIEKVLENKYYGLGIVIGAGIILFSIFVMASVYEQKIPAMTSNNTPSPYIVYASGSGAIGEQTQPFWAFDKNENRWWASQTTGGEWWIAIDVGSVNSFAATNITIRNSVSGTTDLKDFAFQGTNDNSSWNNLIIGSQPKSVGNFTYNFTDNEISYRHYRLYISSGWGASAVRVDELYIFGEFVVDTCTCPGAGNNWEINLADYCVITDNCNLTTGTLSFTGAGNATCDAIITTTNLGDPGASGSLFINDNCLIWIN